MSAPERPEARPAAGPAPLPPPPPPPAPRGDRPAGANLRLALLLAAFVALGVLGSLSAVVVVLCLVVIVFLHELGHYVTAKWAGMKVTEFFIGFGPRIWSFRRGETEYGLKAIPAGAYVRVIGMTNLEEVPPEDEPRTYRQAPYWRRMSVAVAGSAMHFLLALVLLFVILAGYGVAKADHWRVGGLSALGSGESPAQQAGLELGDRIVAIDGVDVAEWNDLVAYVRSHPGADVTLTIERDGRTVTAATTLAPRNPDGEPVGFLGISPTYPRVKASAGEAFTGSFREFGEATKLTFQGLSALFSPSGLSDYADRVLGRTPGGVDVSGGGSGGGGTSRDDNRPVSAVGAVRIASQAADAGIAELLSFLVIFNVFVGVFNLVPLLPLDGGHVAVATYERIRSRRGRRHFVDVNKLLPLTYGVIAVLAVLFLSSLYLDISDPIENPFNP